MGFRFKLLLLTLFIPVFLSGVGFRPASLPSILRTKQEDTKSTESTLATGAARVRGKREGMDREARSQLLPLGTRLPSLPHPTSCLMMRIAVSHLNSSISLMALCQTQIPLTLTATSPRFEVIAGFQRARRRKRRLKRERRGLSRRRKKLVRRRMRRRMKGRLKTRSTNSLEKDPPRQRPVPVPSFSAINQTLRVEMKRTGMLSVFG